MLINAVMELRVPQNAGNFLTSCRPVSFSRSIVLHRDGYSQIVDKYMGGGEGEGRGIRPNLIVYVSEFEKYLVRIRARTLGNLFFVVSFSFYWKMFLHIK